MTLTEGPVKTGRSNLVSDPIAGITTALVTIPDGMASAILAGVNPLNGLYALMVGTPIDAPLIVAGYEAIKVDAIRLEKG